jgi:formamidopyrimidine-DNA glycosylase
LKDATKYIGGKLEKIKDQHKTIAEVLMEQRIFGGVGNYLRAESLHKAKISPFTEIKDIKGDKLKTLIESIRYIMKKSFDAQLKCLKKNGYNYEKLTSCYDFQVYRRKETPDGKVVHHKKLGQGGRMIWYV